MIMDMEANVSYSAEELLPPPNTSLASPASSSWPGLEITNTSLLWPWRDLDWSQVLVWHHEDCQLWQPVNHIYYQLAHLALLLVSLLPLGSAPLVSLIIRLGLVSHSGLLLAWSLLTACSPDSLAWALSLLAVNTLLTLRSATALAAHCAPLQPEVRAAYDALFKPLGVDRKQFKKLLSCTKEIREVSPKETVITEKISRVDCLSLVLSGRLIVSQAGRALHLVNKNQFLDSPEWFGVTTDEFFQVSVTALEPGALLTWHRDRVKFCLMEDAGLQAVFDHVVGRDVVRKLMQVNTLAEELQLNLDKVTRDISDKAESSSSGSGDEKEEYDDKKPMIAKEVVKEKSLLGSLIGGEIPNWRLVNIKETEDETIV